MYRTTTKYTFILLFLFSTISEGQNINESLQQLTEAAAREYLKPVGNGFGANLNTGWVTRSPKAELYGLDIQIGIVVMGAFMPSDSKSFSVTGNVQFTASQAEEIINSVDWAQYNMTPEEEQNAQNNLRVLLLQNVFPAQIAGPTVIGSKKDQVRIILQPSQYSYQGQQIYIPQTEFSTNVKGVLEDYSILPFAAPQLTVGTLFGTQLTLRWVPNVTFDPSVGKVNYFGFGIQHNPLVWFMTPLPVDLSLGFFWQHLTSGDYLESTATEFGIYASKTFGPTYTNVTPYIGVSYQNSTSTVSYDLISTTNFGTTSNRISFDMEGENSSKFLIGLAFRLGVLNLNIDYNIAKFSTLGGGISFLF